MKQISDCLYNYIQVESDEIPVLDATEVQRLRRVNQLGLSSTVYPCGTHTRFAHSLGVMHLAGLFADQLHLPEADRKAARLAGLLHDIGHGPFSHASEQISTQTHEEQSIKLVSQLESRGVLPVSADRIIQFINGTDEYNIISGEIDADRLDYLNRDAHFTGIPHGSVDAHTIINSASLTSDNTLVFDRRATEAIEQFLFSRKNMIGSVYQHPTVRIAENMLREAITHSSVTAPFYKFDDYQLHTKLLSESGIAKELYSRITNRQLYKTAFEIRRRHIDGKLPEYNEETLQAEITAQTSVQPHEVFVDTFEHKKESIDIKIDTTDGILPFEKVSGAKPVVTYDYGDALLLAVYTKENKVTEVNQFLTSYFDTPK